MTERKLGGMEKLGGSQSRVRILPDGRNVPSLAGLKHHTPEWNANIGASLAGKRRLEEYVRRDSNIWNQVRPFFARRLPNKDIALFTGLKPKQVGNSIYSSKTSLVNRIEALTPEETKERKRKSSSPGEPKRLIDRVPATEDEKNNIALVQKFTVDGLFTDDLSSWEKLKKLYAKYGRNLPESSAELLRLEVFLSAIEQAKRGEIGLLNKYAEMGRSIGLEWFKLLAQEERFIKAKLLSYWADGEDEKGFFKLNGSGGKTRQVEREGEGYVTVSSRMILEKLVKMAIQNRTMSAK